LLLLLVRLKKELERGEATGVDVTDVDHAVGENKEKSKELEELELLRDKELCTKAPPQAAAADVGE